MRKKTYQTFVRIVILLFIITHPLFSINVLTVEDTNQYGFLPGYIDKATLVVEPHGSHVEQSLYLSYSDHAQFPAGKRIEIVHRFELPEEAVINDLWLWIEDSVMQAIMLDTWSARKIYDDIVQVKRDPAFLSKNGSQYELHIFPLEPGKFRKIKINFITPCRWIGNIASTPLPVKMLLANNASQKPLNILFRTREEIWNNLRINENPELEYRILKDTLNYHFKYFEIEDISRFDQLTLSFGIEMENGYFCRANQVNEEPIYFQIGFSPKELFNLSTDTPSKKILIGLDYSGLYNRNLEHHIPQITRVLKSALRDKDQFNFLVTGNGQFVKLSEDWMNGSMLTIESLMDTFIKSNFAIQLMQIKKPHIIYADDHASICWKFPGIEELASYETYRNISDAKDHFNEADIIAAYDHGCELALSDETLAALLEPLDNFFNRGGRLLSFYDYNRVGKERLASHFINGLTTRQQSSGQIYRNVDGNIGKFFPESIHHHVISLLEYNDPDVKIEMMDQNGRPAIISKKIKNGLLVVSGLWSFTEDGALRSLVGIPLLGLTSLTAERQLPELLAAMKAACQQDNVDKLIIFSNSDSIIEKKDAEIWVEDYRRSFKSPNPQFHTINLLDASRFSLPYLTEDGKEYCGSGLFLKILSDRTRGIHFEIQRHDWDYIAGVLSPVSAPFREDIKIFANIDDNTGVLNELYEVNPILNDPDKPIFFIGSATGNNTISFNIQEKFLENDTIYQKSITFPVSHDTTNKVNIISSMLGYEKLKLLFQNSRNDTATIVKLAMKHHLLCDYTALLALEPNDTLKFMKDPFDEEDIFTRVQTEKEETDSLEIKLYPNPFNARITIHLNIPQPGIVKVAIYNIRGQLVRELINSSLFPGKSELIWNATDLNEREVSSGLYFVQVLYQNVKNGALLKRVNRILLVR